MYQTCIFTHGTKPIYLHMYQICIFTYVPLPKRLYLDWNTFLSAAKRVLVYVQFCKNLQKGYFGRFRSISNGLCSNVNWSVWSSLMRSFLNIWVVSSSAELTVTVKTNWISHWCYDTETITIWDSESILFTHICVLLCVFQLLLWLWRKSNQSMIRD